MSGGTEEVRNGLAAISLKWLELWHYYCDRAED